MKPLLTALLLLSASSGFAQAPMRPNCVALENAGSELLNNDFPTNMTAISDDRQLIAGYHHFREKNEVLFRLWDTRTGKLLRIKTMGNYKQHSSARLEFSPENRFVYVQGWTNIADLPDNVEMQGVPFWNLATNQTAMPPCRTMEGVSKVVFSNDQKVAHVLSVGGGDYSLCGTTENKVFAHVKWRHLDSETKQLFKTFANNDYQYFHQLHKHLKQSATNKNVTLYKPSAPNEWLKPSTIEPIKTPKIPSPLKSKAPDKKARTSKFLMPGGYASDDQYNASKNSHKFDQYLFFEGRERLADDHFFLLNWQTGEGEIVKLPSGFTSASPHWIPKYQRLILKVRLDYPQSGLVSYDTKTKKINTIYKADAIFEYRSVTNTEGEPELQFVAYDKQAKKNYFCRL